MCYAADLNTSITSATVAASSACLFIHLGVEVHAPPLVSLRRIAIL
jgi:hypothetical protein